LCAGIVASIASIELTKISRTASPAMGNHFEKEHRPLIVHKSSMNHSFGWTIMTSM